MKFLHKSVSDVSRFIYEQGAPSLDPTGSATVDTADGEPKSAEDLTPQEQLEAAIMAAAKNPEGLAEAEALEALVQAEAADLVAKGITRAHLDAYIDSLDEGDRPLDETEIASLSDNSEEIEAALEGEPLPEGLEADLAGMSSEDFLKDLPQEGGLDEEGKPTISRLDTVTKPRISPANLAEGGEVSFDFMFENAQGVEEFNNELWEKTTAGSVMPEKVLALNYEGKTYERRGFGEFFNEQNQRLVIHGNEEHGYTKVEVAKIGTPEEIEAHREKAQQEAAEALEKSGIEEGAENYDRLAAAADMAALKGVDPVLALALAQSDVFAEVTETDQFMAKFEGALIEGHRLQDGLSQTDLTTEDGKVVAQYALDFVSQYVTEEEDRSALLSTLGYEEAEIEQALEAYKRSSVDISGFEQVDLMSEPGFRERLNQVASSIGTTPGNLMQVFKFETAGTFNPAITNGIGATGLIQFIPSTARGLGTSTDALRQMSATEQLDWVEKYYLQYASKDLSGVEDLYLATLYPYALGRPDHYILGSHKGAATAAQIGRQNPAFNGGGPVSVAHVRRKILAA